MSTTETPPANVAASETEPIAHDALARALADAPYHRALGVEVDAIEDESVRLLLPYAASNSNPGGVLHGGVAASLLAIGSRAVARLSLPQNAAPFLLGQLQVAYLSAAREEDVVATATLRRRGRSLCFVDTVVATRADKAIAAASAVVRAGFGESPAVLPQSFGDEGESDPGPLAPHLEKAPFMSGRGMHIEHMAGGRARVSMPHVDGNTDETGRLHDGAILALLDTCGAMAAWAEAGPAPWKASTPSLQAQTLAPAPSGDVVAYARCIQRDREMFWCDTEVTDAATGRVHTRGTVFYRLAE